MGYIHFLFTKNLAEKYAMPLNLFIEHAFKTLEFSFFESFIPEINCKDHKTDCI